MSISQLLLWLWVKEIKRFQVGKIPFYNVHSHAEDGEILFKPVINFISKWAFSFFIFYFQKSKWTVYKCRCLNQGRWRKQVLLQLVSYYCTTPKGVRVDVGFFVFHFLFTKFNLPKMNMIEMLNDCNCRTCNLCRWKKGIWWQTTSHGRYVRLVLLTRRNWTM